MVHFSYLTCLLILWFSLRLVCKVTMTPQDNIAPIPTNLKVALKPGLINVTWDCNISKSMENYSYKILLPKGIQQPIDLHNCFIEINSFEKNELILHNGLEVGLLTCKDGKKVETNWKITFTPEGKNDTAADNLSCVIYNVSVMNCSWSVGKEAPEDTQYSLELRQFEKNYKCQHYRKDSFGRQVGCVLKQHAGIIYEKFVYIQVTGSSNQTSIKFMDKHIKPNNHVTLDPPRNIMLSYNSNLLEIKWERPNTHNYEPDKCFQYDISINGEGLNKDITGPSYTADKYYSNEEVTVTMRVKWKSFCSENSEEWSRWSDPQIHGSGYGQSYSHECPNQKSKCLIH
ncbi:granulocyte-macrophage colony-stimulating factor receptor subunit alpha-like [Mixophyes fleayi]|uniref:granulocyte-macrophage colony-stimulating factor receptor subunit alpha-like n=1 Tax=Mixophyes fleayi TaxID=3061075 RepID=UPI003F4D734F